MNKQVIILIGGASVAVLIVAILITSMLGEQKPKQSANVDVPVVQEYVLVAAIDIARGREIMDDDFKWVKWDTDNALLMRGIKPLMSRDDDEDSDTSEIKASDFPDLITTTNESKSPNGILTGRMRRSLSEGTPVMKKYVFTRKGNVVSMSLEPGMRAMAIKADAKSMVGGFLWPGDYVDVVLVYDVKLKSDVKKVMSNVVDKRAAETILQNVRVLAVDQDATSPPADDGTVGKTVTLAVSNRDAERLAVAQDMGGLTLVLRGFGDDGKVNRKWPLSTDARVTGINEEMAGEYKKMLKRSNSQDSTVVNVYEGEERTQR